MKDTHDFNAIVCKTIENEVIALRDTAKARRKVVAAASHARKFGAVLALTANGLKNTIEHFCILFLYPLLQDAPKFPSGQHSQEAFVRLRPLFACPLCQHLAAFSYDCFNIKRRKFSTVC